MENVGSFFTFYNKIILKFLYNFLYFFPFHNVIFLIFIYNFFLIFSSIHRVDDVNTYVMLNNKY